jgi:hypothetical protein
MARNRNISVPLVGSLFARLRGGGPKTVVAGALVLIMLFMWLRVFVGHRPSAAAGAPAPRPAAADAAQPPVRVTPVELPRTAGRHDSLQRDFFLLHDPTYVRRNAARQTGTDTEVPAMSSIVAQEVIRRVARMLKLQAVLWSDNPHAFINDQWLGVGSKLVVKDGAASVEFEVLQINVNSVLVGCEGIQLTLGLAQFLEVVH